MNRTGHRGFILVMSLTIMAALFFFGLAFMNLFRMEKQLAQRQEQMIIADAAARAGLEDALFQLRQNRNWSDGFNSLALPASGAAYSITFDEKNTRIPWSTNNFNGEAPVSGWKGRTVPPHCAHLVCTGSYGSTSTTRQYIVEAINLLFQDTFDSGNTLWDQRAGSNFLVMDGLYTIGKPAPQTSVSHRAFTGSNTWTDVEIEVKIALISGNGFGIFFRTTDYTPLKSYCFQFEPGYKGGAFTFRTWNRVDGVNNVESEPFAEVQRALIPDLPGDDTWWYDTQRTVKLVVSGNHFTASVDGVQVLDAVDAANTFPSGQIGLRTLPDSLIQVDEVNVLGGSNYAVRVKSRF